MVFFDKPLQSTFGDLEVTADIKHQIVVPQPTNGFSGTVVNDNRLTVREVFTLFAQNYAARDVPACRAWPSSCPTSATSRSLNSPTPILPPCRKVAPVEAKKRSAPSRSCSGSPVG